MPGRVRTDALVAGGRGFHGAGEVRGAIVGPIVGDHPMDLLDAVSGEERFRPGEEPDDGDRFLVLGRFGVGQAREPVDGRM